MIDFTASYTDYYELTMAYAYYQKGMHNQRAVFDYFFRKLPFNGGYAVFAGLQTLLEVLESFRFSATDIDYIRKQGFSEDFLAYLKEFKFEGNIRSCAEGEVVFPTMPILQVEGTIIETQLVETLLLNILNFQTLIATKAARMRQVAGDRVLMDFGLRRAQSVGGYHASRAAIIGGFDATSNVRAAMDFGIAPSGTMAHSYIQSFDDELTAFRYFAETHPNDCVLLVDTYSTLESGLPNAITVGKEMEAKGFRLKGIRLDSGDLAYLSKQCRKELDAAGLNYVSVAASNQLDEHIIKSLLAQGAAIDVFGVGTSLVTGSPNAALDGVYKLTWFDDLPRIKISENITKTTLPGKKQVLRFQYPNGKWIGTDAITLEHEDVITAVNHPYETHKRKELKGCKSIPLMSTVMAHGKTVVPKMSLTEIAKFSQSRIDLLPMEYKRFEYPHIYKVGISNALKEQRDNLIVSHRK